MNTTAINSNNLLSLDETNTRELNSKDLSWIGQHYLVNLANDGTDSSALS